MVKIRLTSDDWCVDKGTVIEAYSVGPPAAGWYVIAGGSRLGYNVYVPDGGVSTGEWEGEFVEGGEVVTNDVVNHPTHYTSHPSGIEAIEITRHYLFSVGNAIKYLWRAGLKAEVGKEDLDKEIEDLSKAVWYINDRIAQLKNLKEKGASNDS